MAMVKCFGLMVLITKEIGKTITKTEKEKWFGNLVKPMRENGSWDYKMVKVQCRGPMVIITKEISSMDYWKVREHIGLQMESFKRENGKQIISCLNVNLKK